MKYHDIEAFYRMEWKRLLRKFYVIQKMSSYEIAEKIRQDVRIDYTYRAVQLWLVKFGFIRNHVKALKNRVLTGRMDYSQRKFDYNGRFIDYGLRDRGRGYLWAIGLRRLLRNKGDTTRLANALGFPDLGSVSDWKNLRHKVSPGYQELICSCFGIDPNQIFSEVATFTVPKLGVGGLIDHKTRLIQQGYRYATNPREIMYKKRISINNLANRLGKPRTSISRWIHGVLVSPVEQCRVENILRVSKDKIFSI